MVWDEVWWYKLVVRLCKCVHEPMVRTAASLSWSSATQFWLSNGSYFADFLCWFQQVLNQSSVLIVLSPQFQYYSFCFGGTASRYGALAESSTQCNKKGSLQPPPRLWLEQVF